VMAWARERIKYQPVINTAPVAKPVMQIAIRPNDPCPCGSSKKYKHCCRNRS
jgi:uncharacterized protein YecA (UPF0149 family)